MYAVYKILGWKHFLIIGWTLVAKLEDLLRDELVGSAGETYLSQIFIWVFGGWKASNSRFYW